MPVPIATAILANVRVLWPKGLNTSYYLDVNAFSRQTAWAHPFMHNYALWLGPVLLAVVFLVAYVVVWWRRWPRVATVLVLGGLGTVIALGLNQLVGHAAEELRPFVSHPHALVLVPKAHDYSFPSDHSIVAGGLTMALLLAALQLGASSAESGWLGRERVGTRRLLVVLTALNLLLGLFLCFARVYVGVHYPGDVVAGFLLSSLVVTIMMLFRPLAFRLTDALETTVLGAVVRRPGGDQLAGLGKGPGRASLDGRPLEESPGRRV